MKEIEESEPSGQGNALAQDMQEAQSLLLTLRQGEFSAKIDKVLVYLQSAAKGKDAKTVNDFIRFAHLNLDAVLVQALESLVYRPRLASKTEEKKKAMALQKAFDRLDNPEKAMLEHYKSSSDPLNKYLVAGPWGHEYLKKRGLDPAHIAAFERELCDLLGCSNTAAGRTVLAYAILSLALDRLQSELLKALPRSGPK
jgi:hypothetical protein